MIFIPGAPAKVFIMGVGVAGLGEVSTVIIYSSLSPLLSNIPSDRAN
jgi:hypothetical protein